MHRAFGLSLCFVLSILGWKRIKEKSLKCLIFSDFLNLVIFTSGPTWSQNSESR